MGNMCTKCGVGIAKSGIVDPYLCRECERTISEGKIYAYLD